MDNLNTAPNDLTIVALGDSLTFGYGIDKEHTITSALQREFTSYNIFNKGINGNSTRDCLARFNNDVLNLNPDVIFIWLGSNDSAYEECRHCSLIEYEKNLSFMIESLKKLDKSNLSNNPHNQLPKIILITPPPVIDEYVSPFTDTDNISGYVNILCELSSKYDLELINFFEIFLDINGKNENDFRAYFQSDGIHLSLKAYELINDTVVHTIKNFTD